MLVQNPATKQTELGDRVVRRLEGVVIARSYSLLEYNVPQAKLAEAEKVTPGFDSPTISKLEEEGWYAVRAMVKRSEVIDIMERLDALELLLLSSRPPSRTAGSSSKSLNLSSQ